MTKIEQNRVLAWRLKVLREASAAPRIVVTDPSQSTPKLFFVSIMLELYKLEDGPATGLPGTSASLGAVLPQAAVLVLMEQQ